jgi:hypothetical protein
MKEIISGDTLLKDCQLFIDAKQITFDVIEFLDVEDKDECKSAIVGMSIALRSLLRTMKDHDKDEKCSKFFEKLAIELIQHGFEKMEECHKKKNLTSKES